MSSVLFSEFELDGLKLRNRLVMAPMCMYSAKGGHASEFHMVHYTARALGGIGLIIQEATGVEPCGRITDDCLGLYQDSQVEGLARIVDSVKAAGAHMGVQLGHAGRKCKAAEPVIYGPSPIAFDDSYPTPAEMTHADIDRVVEAFGSAAARAKKVGYDLVEVHAAHGYLLSSFLSPLSNQRTDEYGGGSHENRARILQRVLDVVQREFGGTVTVRVSAVDYADGGNTVEDIIKILQLVKGKVRLVNVSSGAVVPTPVPTYAGYQITFAEQIRRACGLPTMAGGLLENPHHLEELVRNQRTDLVYLGRALLRNPHLPLAAAEALRAEIEWPKPYLRAKNERI